MAKLIQTGIQTPGDCYYVIDDVTVGRISFCLHTFGIIRQHEINVFVLVEMHAFLNFTILGRGSAPSLDPPSLLFEIKFLFKNLKFYFANQSVPVPRRHKSKHWMEWASFEESWYVCTAILLPTGTN